MQRTRWRSAALGASTHTASVFGASVFGASVVCASLLVGRGAHAQSAAPPVSADITKQCVDAHLTTQKLRKVAKLTEAKDALLVCVQQQCPAPVQRDCAGWLPELEAQIPSIVVVARDAEGRDTSDVRVSMDGVAIGDRLDGVAMPLDPGSHVIRCEHAGAVRVEKVVVVQAQKSRAIMCSFAVEMPVKKQRPGPAADAAQPIAGYIIGAVSLGAFASFAALGISAKGEADDLDTTCGKGAPAPLTQTCTDAQIDPVRTKLIAADISLGAGVGFLALSMGLLLHHFLSDPVDEAASTAIRVDLGPTRGGAAAQFTVSF